MFLDTNIFEKISNAVIYRSPFDHLVIDDFFDVDVAYLIEHGFPVFDSDIWHVYSNSIEEKKTCNQWNLFSNVIYKAFDFLNSKEFTDCLTSKFDTPLLPDHGLHGGGLHIHSSGGNLNPHLDYSIHPKLGLQRRLNIIIYVSSDARLHQSQEGALGLWSGDAVSPIRLEKELLPKFNRAVIFDTTQHSWHGITRALSCGAEYTRKSLAAYYLQSPAHDADPRTRALFAPRDDQKDRRDVLDLIEKRSSELSFSSVYKT